MLETFLEHSSVKHLLAALSYWCSLMAAFFLMLIGGEGTRKKLSQCYVRGMWEMLQYRAVTLHVVVYCFISGGLSASSHLLHGASSALTCPLHRQLSHSKMCVSSFQYRCMLFGTRLRPVIVAYRGVHKMCHICIVKLVTFTGSAILLKLCTEKFLLIFFFLFVNV